MGNPVIRNFTVKVDKKSKKSTFDLYEYPVEVLTPTGWVSIKEEIEDLTRKAEDPFYEMTEEESKLYEEYRDIVGTFSERRIAQSIILDTADVDGIDIVGRDRVPHVIDAETKAEIKYPREFSYVYGASDISGVIVLPYDDYSDVYVVTDSDEDGVGELSYIKEKVETGGQRPYYEKVDGKTFIYVNHFSGGGGTQTDPYIVSNEFDLNDIRNKPSAYYRQDRDIAIGSYNSGEGWVPIPMFTGVYDGDGFGIKGLFINRPQATYVGLFGQVNKATIRGLRLISPYVVGKSTVGALIGDSVDGRVYHCGVEGGTVDGTSYVGGLIGKCANSNSSNSWFIQYCYNYKCTVQSNGGNNIGGLTGYAIGMSNSYGIIRCMCIAPVIDTSLAQTATAIGAIASYGGTVGQSYTYYDLEVATRKDGSTGTTGLTTMQMKTLASFAVNTDLYWYVGTSHNDGYPSHRQFIRYERGRGTEDSPYILSTEDELDQVRWFAKGTYFELEDDIKFTKFKDGEGFRPLATTLDNVVPAKINFNGKGRAIYGLTINRPSADHQSLFGNIGNSRIENLDLVDFTVQGRDFSASLCSPYGETQVINCHAIKIDSARVSGQSLCGTLIGLATGVKTIIKKCSSDADLSVIGNYGGGLIGTLNASATAAECYFNGSINTTAGYAGGLLGKLENGNILDCLSNPKTFLTGPYSGGFVGNTNSSVGEIKRCISLHSTAIFNGYPSANPPTFVGNFYLSSVSGTNNVIATSRLEVELKNRAFYESQTSAAWNFDTIWIIDENINKGFPMLRALVPPDSPILGFRNEFGKYYTDTKNQVLRYLEFGTMIASQTSRPKAVWLQNNADFSVNAMKVYVDEQSVAEGINVELSSSETPFIPVKELTFNGTFAKGTAAKFYVRMGSDISVKDSGTWDLRAKASPV